MSRGKAQASIEGRLQVHRLTSNCLNMSELPTGLETSGYLQTSVLVLLEDALKAPLSTVQRVLSQWQALAVVGGSSLGNFFQSVPK